MCDRQKNKQNRILTLSALMASGFALGGLVLGLMMGSLVIVFDGVYSLVSLLLTLLSLAAAYYINTPSKSIFPFGKAVLEPVVIAIKASVILLVVSVSLYSAVTALFSGGREVNASIASLFGLVNVIGCALAWWLVAGKARKVQSGLVDAEVSQWKMDTLLSLAVTAGFIVAMGLQFTPWAHLAVYADPVMMLLMSFYFIKVPFDMLRGATREMLMMAPEHDLRDEVHQDVLTVGQLSDQEIRLAGVTKVGQELRVNVDMYVQGKTLAVEDVNHIRAMLKQRLTKHQFQLALQLNIAA
ncbi:cation transporter [Vibrio sp. SM6]|uniref:Cation transporter n=1 Tax=Vibrio agarilyticus TaxID=2726741 RepID=A0A7X8YI52_9VIBR|nr:cation transporter [Vibrio agarilyticus]NLS14813.1 cation transporter [Vibrio agarilyticus]